MDPVRVGLLGVGTVGGGICEVLRRNASEIGRRAGREIVIQRAADLDAGRRASVAGFGFEVGADAREVIDDPAVDVVVELIGGTTIALDLVQQAIAKGKPVVTANKALIATHGNEIFAAAHARGVMVAFEAAVAGGIPVIKAIREGLAGNRVEWVVGIINGTCNFILTEMREKGRDFADVLAEAQRLGYAEADPSFDIHGTDAAHKLTILAAIAFGIPLQFDKVHCEGIDGITALDVAFADQLGYRIRHVGIARRAEGGIELRVHPALVPVRCLLANVNGVMNGVTIKGNAVGQLSLQGAGAGALPTASAVAADLVDVARALTTDRENRVPHLAFQPDAMADHPILAMPEVECACYLRFSAEDRPGVLADVTRILADAGISIETIWQKEPDPGCDSVPIILLTQRVKERAVNAAMERIGRLPQIRGRVARIRLETLDP
jgi:homoserine dehydrogenase